MTPETPDDAELLASPPDLRLDGRVAWITGASRGLGRALAFAFAGAGAELLLSARSEGPLLQTAETIRAAGGRAEICAGSIADPAHLETACALARKCWGRLDVLVNNAGVSPVLDRAEHIDLDRFSEVVEVNLTGSFRTARAALPLLRDAPAGCVVNVSSIHGVTPHERLIAYSASKAALESMSRTLALEWAGEKIRVNCVAPGYVATDMTAGLQGSPGVYQGLLDRIPLGRFAQPREIVGAVLFLAADVAGYVTGTTLTVDGGWTAR